MSRVWDVGKGGRSSAPVEAWGFSPMKNSANQRPLGPGSSAHRKSPLPKRDLSSRPKPSLVWRDQQSQRSQNPNKSGCPMSRVWDVGKGGRSSASVEAWGFSPMKYSADQRPLGPGFSTRRKSPLPKRDLSSRPKRSAVERPAVRAILDTITSEGAPSFRALCGRVGRSNPSSSVLDAALNHRGH